MKFPLLPLWLGLLGALPCAAARGGVVVQGVEMFRDDKNVPITGTDRPADFNAEALGHHLAVSFADVPAGALTIEIDEAETYYKKPDARVMALTANGTILQPRLDIFQEAGFAVALPKRFAFDHPGGRLKIELVALKDMAKFGAIRLLDATDRVFAQVNAREKIGVQRAGRPAGYQLRDERELVYFNADHSPEGAYAGFLYGDQGTWGGFEAMQGEVPAGGVVIGLEEGGQLSLLPFIDKDQVSDRARYVEDASVHRTMRACTDAWSLPGLGWTHYSPSWHLADIDRADDEEKRRAVLPATWMVFTVDNRGSAVPKTLCFGLPATAERRTFAGGRYAGFVVGGRHVLAVPAGACELLDGKALAACCPNLDAGFVFRFTVPPGAVGTLPVIVAHHDGGVVASQIKARFYYTTLFPTLDDVVAYAGAHQAGAVERSRRLDAVLDASGQNVYRRFLAGHALHSYRYSTVLLATPDGRPAWSEQEGGYGNTNTFDLTVDHLFYDVAMHPWVIRNVLDRFADSYCLTLPITDPRTHQSGPPCLFFNHDMGGGAAGKVVYNPPGQPSGYERAMGFMGQEQTQNWVLCAGVYWKQTGDDAWLRRRAATFRACLQSMLLRDDPDPARRDGVTDFVNFNPAGKEEITTYDSLDASLRPADRSGYLAVNSWAAYLALEAAFRALGDEDDAAVAGRQAALTAAAVVANWKKDEKYLPAVFDGKTTARILPVIEGLAYPYAMGLTGATAPGGPYAELLRVLHDHVDNALRPGVCLDPATGAWKLSSTSQNTWQSKVYLAQFITERILGIKDERVSGKVDQVHASFQVCGAAPRAWSDQLDSATSRVLGSDHYPRGVTSALWWLDAKNAAAGQ